MSTDTSLQAFLDSLSQVPGSILYRNDFQWQALAPTAAGQVLALDDDLMPFWKQYRDYFPAMLQYGPYLSKLESTAINVSNADWMLLVRWAGAPSINGERLVYSAGGGGEAFDCYLGSTGLVNVKARDGSNNIYFQQRSDVTFMDDDPHYLLCDYQKSTGDFRFIIDGEEHDDPTWGGAISVAATPRNGAGFRFTVGNINGINRQYQGAIGCVGFAHAYDQNIDNFMTPYGWPVPVDPSGWPAFGTTPRFWNPSGDLRNNLGADGNFTQTGTVEIADPLIWS